MDVKAKEPAALVALTRLVEAPRALMWKARTDREQLVQWFAPKPYTLIIHKMDLRPGGKFSMAMRGPDGNDFPFTGIYSEIVPMAKIIWTGEFSSGPADQRR